MSKQSWAQGADRLRAKLSKPTLTAPRTNAEKVVSKVPSVPQHLGPQGSKKRNQQYMKTEVLTTRPGEIIKAEVAKVIGAYAQTNTAKARGDVRCPF